ncbi:MAG TPA: glycoside hydrolase family 9 protein [Gemmatimonadaceae bacterium]|nr:glycoside hydrolase family 9 protein [Gemmatimonadaceae bacterium]
MNAFLLLALALPAAQSDSTSFIRVNQVGYLPDAPKVAVVCSLERVEVTSFRVRDETGRVVLGPRRAVRDGHFGPCVVTQRLDFTELRQPGRYTIEAGSAAPVSVRISATAFDGGADTALYYMRQQRSGWNPLFRDSVHRYDGNVIDDSGKVVKWIPVSGGWADASDYLQYVTTSATATYMLMAAHRDNPRAFADAFDARGLPGANGVADVVDEARHGLDWLRRMYPGGEEMYNQLGDDRDHAFFDLLSNDSSDYGWGRGRERPVYPCTGRPQGVLRYRNRATGYASTAGKYASVFALAASTVARDDTALSRTFRERATDAYELGRKHPGVCQTAPGSSPYFYEEDNWVDDMELGAAQLFALTRESRYLIQAAAYARQEPVTPWMGADTARHYQWFPWHNNGHYELWRVGSQADREAAVRYYRAGLEKTIARATNGFRVGIPFIWCSNNLMASFATQALLYRRMTGDQRFRRYEQAAIDWLFGANPWGTSMMVGYPNGATSARDPHSVHADRLGVHVLLGGLLDGPVYRSIYASLRGISLHDPDEYARFNTGFVVYHDDLGDYSTNEPIMDGTASMVYLLSSLSSRAGR